MMGRRCILGWMVPVGAMGGGGNGHSISVNVVLKVSLSRPASVDEVAARGGAVDRAADEVGAGGRGGDCIMCCACALLLIWCLLGLLATGEHWSGGDAVSLPPSSHTSEACAAGRDSCRWEVQ
jgi:hypothetical protein